MEEERTRTVIKALRAVVKQRGWFVSLYSGRASHLFVTSKAGSHLNEAWQTLLGRAPKEVRIRRIPADSPHAGGRQERNDRTRQGRLPQPLRLGGCEPGGGGWFPAGGAHRHIEEFNRRFRKPARKRGRPVQD